jgi:DNA-binding MarR family transcriptional regulator
MSDGITNRIIEFVNQNPGHRAWFIAKRLNADTATVSSILKKLADRRVIKRWKLKDPEAWCYDPVSRNESSHS